MAKMPLTTHPEVIICDNKVFSLECYDIEYRY